MSEKILVGKWEREAGHITKRELQMLEMASLGHNNVSIAKALSLSVGTVDQTIAHARESLGAKTTAHAVRLAMEAKLWESK